MLTTETMPTAALRSFRYLGNEVRIHADLSDTGGQLAVLEMHSFPGAEPPMHIHDDADEFFFVLEGRMKLISDGVEAILSPGDSAIAKRGTPHTFKILSPSLRSMAIFTPAGFEDFFRALAGDPPPSHEMVGKVAARFNTRLVQPASAR